MLAFIPGMYLLLLLMASRWSGALTGNDAKVNARKEQEKQQQDKDSEQEQKKDEEQRDEEQQSKTKNTDQQEQQDDQQQDSDQQQSEDQLMTPEEAQRLLDALNDEEKKTLSLRSMKMKQEMRQGDDW